MQFVEAIPAATIVLIRDIDDHFELFLQQRHRSTDFGSVYVFPGGKVNINDTLYEKDYTISGLTADEANKKLNIESDGIDYWIAAVRECFEEAGLLLAYDDKGDQVEFSDNVTNKRFQTYREKINAKELEFYQMCQKEHLTLSLDEIHPCGHWITPVGSPYRYDTRFFIARAPKKQKGHHDNHEAVKSMWLTPQEAVDGYYQRKLPMILPTIDTIETLTQFINVDDVLSHMAGYTPGRARSFF